jgi:hypothetical protein
MSDNFNLKRFLTENKLTTNARAVGDVNEESQSIGLTLTPGEVSAVLDALASSNIENNISKAGQMQSGGNRILANLAQATAKLKNAYYPNPQADLAEGTSASWKDLWDALQAALAKESDAEADNALKVIAKAAASKVGASVKGKLEKYNDSLNEGGNRERQVYDIVEDSVEKALSAIEQYKNTADTDQSGDLGIFHDVEVALEDVLDFLIYTQKPDVD